MIIELMDAIVEPILSQVSASETARLIHVYGKHSPMALAAESGKPHDSNHIAHS